MTQLDPEPDICNTDYDTLALIDGELFVFKNKYVWKFKNQMSNINNPFHIYDIWRFPVNETLSNINAVYQNKEKKTIFFVGNKYYSFDGSYLEEGYPKLLSNLGLPNELERIDAAFIWGHNNSTYLYSGVLYWVFNEDEKKVEIYYPRDMTEWAGIGYHIKAALAYKNGKTYFFKNNYFYEFNDKRMQVAHLRPKKTALRWFKCPKRSPH
ncbi:matrix metalloproteinase-2-like [Condylostylus longicornis]|uniref:matrix metalloproteinase-2-like n=1 Tax=Condylostylus longicornis TaxID=2530218 RepID=UPI00244DF57F|nr:matrix metalloproteinase-2-like [Condylostylus longicornis]